MAPSKSVQLWVGGKRLRGKKLGLHDLRRGARRGAAGSRAAREKCHYTHNAISRLPTTCQARGAQGPAVEFRSVSIGLQGRGAAAWRQLLRVGQQRGEGLYRSNACRNTC